MYFTFQNPSYLFLLFIIPILIFLHFYNLKHIRTRALKFANFDAIARVKGIDLYSKNITFLIIDTLMIIFLVLSLSGFTLNMDVNSSKFSFVVAIDNSESMGATDITPNRLAAAKEAATEFVNSLPSYSRVGIVSFSGNSYVEQDMTKDKELLKIGIGKIQLTDIGGTDIYEAISTSSFLLSKESDKAIVLISDGQINTGTAQDIFTSDKFKDIVIHTIAIGTKEGGKTQFGISKVDEETLKAISYNMKGKFFSINNKDEFKNAFLEIIPMTKKMGSISLSFYLLILALIFLILKLALTQFSVIAT